MACEDANSELIEVVAVAAVADVAERNVLTTVLYADLADEFWS